MPTTKPTFERLEARVSHDKKHLFKYAADLSGHTLTDFLIAAAYEAATRIIKEHELLELSKKDRDVFFDALLHPSKPSSKLVNAAKKYKKNVTSK